MFSNFLNKSFKAVYNTFSTATPRPQITFLKLTSLLYKPSLELPSIFLIYNNTLHIYHFQNLPIVNFNLFCKYPLSTPIISVHPVNHIPSFTSSLPVIAILPTNQNAIHFINLNTKSLLKIIELPSSVLSISFNRKYFGVACSNRKILIYSNNSLSEKEVLPIYAISKDKISKIISQAHFTRSMFNSNSNSNNNSSNSSRSSSNIIFDMSDNFIMYYISHPNTTANAVEHQNPHENPLYNSTSNIPNKSQSNTFEKIASNTYQSIKDFTSWGVQSLKNYNSLLQSKNISIPTSSPTTSIYVNNTTNLKNATVINIFNISHAYTTHPNHNNSSNTTSSQIDVFALPYQLHIPSFKEGINSIKQIQNGKYIIIGNAHNQLFYIFELYPQTNKKYNINYIHNTSNRYKAIYSLFRGVTKCELNSLDISINNEYALITSQKGTHHVYHLPKRDNQINENVNGVSCGCYTNDDLLNLKIVEANEIAKYKYDYYKNNNDKCHSLYDSMFINVDKITIEDNFNQNNSTKVMEIAKDKFSPYIHHGNYLVMVTDDKVNVVLIVNKKIIIPLNTFMINLDESEENVRRNYSIIMKQCSPMMNNNNNKYNGNSNSSVYDDIHLGQICTDLSNFPVFQLNPLFTFNKAVDVVSESTTTLTASTMKNVLLHVQNVFQFEFTTDNGFNVYCTNSNSNNNNSEIHLLNELCNKQHDIYTKIKSKRKLSDNYNDSIHSKSIIINPNFQDSLRSSCELKETFYENKASILQSNITQAINSSIHDKLQQTNEVTIQSKFEIHDNYY